MLDYFPVQHGISGVTQHFDGTRNILEIFQVVFNRLTHDFGAGSV